MIATLEEYAVECSINKVFATEALAAVVDDTVQIFGGYGFVEDYPAARRYRDARISRIYEGTNEINRIVIPSLLLRRARAGRLDLLAAARQVADEVLRPPVDHPGASSGPLADERHFVDGARRGALFAAGAAVQKYATDLGERQEILGWIADLAIEVFAAESAVLRAAKVSARGDAAADLQTAMVRLHLDEALPKIEGAARRILAATDDGDALRTSLAGLRRFVKVPTRNTAALTQQIAVAVLERGR
jgi:butyryl-CoA dehydrogenase